MSDREDGVLTNLKVMAAGQRSLGFDLTRLFKMLSQEEVSLGNYITPPPAVVGI